MQNPRWERSHRLARSYATATASGAAAMVDVLLCNGWAIDYLAGRLGAPAVAFLFFQNTDGDAVRGYHLSQPRGVVFRPAFQRNEENLALETYPPMQVAGVITEFDRVTDRARFE